jgi:hypothetical protein
MEPPAPMDIIKGPIIAMFCETLPDKREFSNEGEV